jgi:hypothetical protein
LNVETAVTAVRQLDSARSMGYANMARLSFRCRILLIVTVMVMVIP